MITAFGAGCAGLGLLCSAGLVAQTGSPWGCAAAALYVLGGGAAVVQSVATARRERRMLAEFREHEAALHTTAGLASDTVESAARSLVDAAERAVADAAEKVKALEGTLEAARSNHDRSCSDTGGALEMKSAFVSKVSHELRTPLAGIKAYVEMLIDGEAQDDPTRREFYDVILMEANRLGRLIDDILSISRIEAGLARPEMRPLDLAAVVRDAVAAVKADADRKRLTIVVPADGPAYETFADPDMLGQAVNTLLANAVKFSPDGGRITVEIVTSPRAKTVLTRIRDDGPGVEPKDVPAVFDKFNRTQTSPRSAGGAGVGLTLVRRIVESVHGGRVFVEPHAGPGNCFGFELGLGVQQDRMLPLAG